MAKIELKNMVKTRFGHYSLGTAIGKEGQFVRRVSLFSIASMTFQVFAIYTLYTYFLPSSYLHLTLPIDSAWLLEPLSNLSRRSRLALGHLYPRSKQRLSYALATIYQRRPNDLPTILNLPSLFPLTVLPAT